MTGLTIKKLKELLSNDINGWSPSLGVWSTGYLSLDMILGTDGKNYGMPKGVIVEVFGHSDSGKTAAVIQWTKHLLDSGGSAVYFDVDGRLNLQFIADIGIDPEIETDIFGVYKNYSMTEVFKIIEMEMHRRDLIIVDSIASMATDDEISSEFGNMPISEQNFLHQLNRSLLMLRHLNKRSTIILVNQVRQDMNNGFGYHAAFPTAVKPNVHIRIDVKKIRQITREDENYLGFSHIGHQASFEVIKNETFKPHGKSVLTLNYKDGFNSTEDIINMALDLDLIPIDTNTRSKELIKDIEDNVNKWRELIISKYKETDKWYGSPNVNY